MGKRLWNRPQYGCIVNFFYSTFFYSTKGSVPKISPIGWGGGRCDGRSLETNKHAISSSNRFEVLHESIATLNKWRKGFRDSFVASSTGISSVFVRTW